MKNKVRVLLLLLFIVLMLAPGFVHAQVVDDPGCDPFDPLCPIDGGLSLLLAAGIGIGAKKAYDGRKNASATGEKEI